jgi:RNA polymerase sigma-70 factor (ECF subfamily)
MLMGSDEQLMLQARNDDAAAFEELVMRYQDRLITLMAQLRGHDRAEVMAQETLIRIHQARKSYDRRLSFRTMLFSVAHEVASAP